MNERIKELANEARTYALTLEDREEDYVDVFEQKFAELIVRECIKVVDDTMTGNQEMNIGLVMASAAIVSHFGVEE